MVKDDLISKNKLCNFIAEHYLNSGPEQVGRLCYHVALDIYQEALYGITYKGNVEEYNDYSGS